MNIRELYMEALKGKHHSLQMMISFLLYEKKVIALEDDESVLQRYFLEKHKSKMNGLLAEYEGRKP